MNVDMYIEDIRADVEAARYVLILALKANSPSISNIERISVPLGYDESISQTWAL